MRRSAVSVAANIAEAYNRNSAKDKLRILNLSKGSLEETRYFLMLTEDLGYVRTGPQIALAKECSKLLGLYSRAIEKRSAEGASFT